MHSHARPLLLAGTVSTFAATWLFRWLTVAFTNDHFVHLSRGRQILFGELPIRDFFDPGLFLQYYASAAALAVSGTDLMGEAILTVTLVAVGAALTFYLAARGSGSFLLATGAAAGAVLTFPRLYNYPKAFIYVLALAWIWKYAERCTTTSLVSLAVVTAIGFLFRHDHGVYIGLSAAAVILLTHRNEVTVGVKALARYAAVVAACLLPFFVFLQLTTGVVTYFSDIPDVRGVTTPRLLRLHFDIDRSVPLLAITPPSAGRVVIRWAKGVNDSERRDLEARYGLTEPLDQEGGAWRYDVPSTRATSESLRALLGDPAVADTSGIDRESLALVVHHGWLRELRNRLPPLRMRVAPGLLTEQNALAWLYYVTMLLPVAGAVAVGIGWWRGTVPAARLAALSATILMCAAIDQGLIRESPDSRLPDVAAPAAVLGALVGGLMLGGCRSLVARAVVTLVAVVTLWSAATYGQTAGHVATARVLSGPTGLLERWREVHRQLRTRPIDVYAPPGSTGLQALTRYALECTSPSDRLFVMWFAPEVFFYAERLFAGGQVYLDPGGWHSSPRDQQLTLERLRNQRVPIVLISADSEAEVSIRFARVNEYVRQRYEEAARSAFGGDREYAVLVDRSIPRTKTYAPLGLPCYRDDTP